MYIQIIFLYLPDDTASRKYVAEFKGLVDSLTSDALHVVLPQQVVSGNVDDIRKALELGRFGGLSLADLPAMYVESSEKNAFAISLRDDRETLKTVIRLMVAMANGSVPFSTWENEINRKLRENGKTPSFLLHIDGVNMGDTYNVGNAGAVGPHSSATNVTFNSAAANLASQLDVNALVAQLAQLRAEMLKEATDGNHYEAIAAVAKAEDAMKKGETSGALGNLKVAGKWALDIAVKIGVSVAAKAIEGVIKM